LEIAMAEKVQVYGEQLEGDAKRGWALYEVGNYHYLLGRFPEAREYLRRSRDVEVAAGAGRIAEAAQSAIREARVAFAQQEYEEAAELVADGLRMLDQAAEALDPRRLSRFRANGYFHQGEVEMCRGNLEEADRLFRLYRKEVGISDVMPHGDLGDARLAILRGEGAEAIRIARAVLDDIIALTTAEAWEQCHRVLGDAWSLMGELDKAERAYREILPVKHEPASYEALLARDRLHRLRSPTGLTHADFRTLPV
jgi:tetratricopeptide (TPR) repeat protein